MSETAVAPKRETKDAPRLNPRYHVILLNDDDHSFEYVIRMMKDLFKHPLEKGFQIAMEVHEEGQSIVYTGPKEAAEFHQERVHGFGADPLIPRCAGSMTAVVESAD